MPYHTFENPVFGRTCFALAHLACPIAIYEIYKLGFCLQAILVITAGWAYDLVGGLGITCGAHRLWSHRAFEASLPFRFVLMLLNCIAFQGELYYWVRDHRVHHKYSDTAADPHDMDRGFWFSHFGWLWMERTAECKKALTEVPMKDITADPVIRFQLQYYLPLCVLMRGLIPFCIGFAITGNWRIALYYNVCQMWVQSLHHTFFVNSASHKGSWGERPYDPDILPCENLLTIYCALGEGHHNWHHCFAQDYATSELGWRRTFNPSKWFIDMAARAGMVTKRRRWKKRDPSQPDAQLAKNYVGTVIKDCKDDDP